MTSELGMRPASAPASTVPSFWVGGGQGRTSSPTTPVSCTFTASGTNSPASASTTDRATSCRAVLGLVRGGPQVWRDDDLRQLERRAGGGWFVDVDVDPGAADVPAAASSSASSSTSPPRAAFHDQDARLGQCELVLADEAEGVGVFRKWTVIAAWRSRSSLSQLDARAALPEPAPRTGRRR